MTIDPKLNNLKHRIEKAKKEAHPPSIEENKRFNTLGRFFNLGVELVSGVFVGMGCGLLIDGIFGTSPWGLISLFILGSIAGMLNVYRALTTKDKKATKRDTDV